MIMNMTRNLPGIEIGVMSPYLRAAESVHFFRRRERSRACARVSARVRPRGYAAPAYAHKAHTVRNFAQHPTVETVVATK